jgi:hypothetical protein
MELLIANITYVAYRLVISASIVSVLNKYMNYYWAVLVMSQVSFLYDNIIFSVYYSAQEMPRLSDLIYADVLYTLRVVVAWFIIKKLWDWLGNWYVAVFLGAQLTFAVDYFIFKGVY